MCVGQGAAAAGDRLHSGARNVSEHAAQGEPGTVRFQRKAGAACGAGMVQRPRENRLSTRRAQIPKHQQKRVWDLSSVQSEGLDTDTPVSARTPSASSWLLNTFSAKNNQGSLQTSLIPGRRQESRRRTQSTSSHEKQRNCSENDVDVPKGRAGLVGVPPAKSGTI